MTKIRVSEANIQSAILDYLRKRQIFHWRNNTGMLRDKTNRPVFFGSKGSPDIIAIVGGYFVGIECKASDGKLNENQEAFREKVQDAGGIYLAPKGFDQAVEAIEDCIDRIRIKQHPMYQMGADGKIEIISETKAKGRKSK